MYVLEVSIQKKSDYLLVPRGIGYLAGGGMQSMTICETVQNKNRG